MLEINGYDPISRIYADGPRSETVSLVEACRLLRELLADFQFQTESDQSRALAALITPALIQGALLGGRAPIDLGEADQSQAGKGYRNKLTAAIYGQHVSTVTQKRRGVGSEVETFDTLLVEGRNFICLDNLRGRFDSPAIESFLTEDRYSARIPHQRSVEIDPKRVVVQMTSNRADVTVDLANRASCVRILKNPENHEYRQYAEGDILDHVRAHQPLYLGAVFVIVREWHSQGRPRSTESRHDFRQWAQTLDRIVQNILGAAPLMDGHAQAKRRITSPGLNWLKDVAHAVKRAGRLGEPLRAADIFEILLGEPDIVLPGSGAHTDRSSVERGAAQQAIGRKLALCCGNGGEMVLDGMSVTPQSGRDERSRRNVTTYLFSAAPIAEGNRRTSGAPIGANDPGHSKEDGKHDIRA